MKDDRVRDGETWYAPEAASAMLGHSQCTCQTVWQSILPPPPCPVHGGLSNSWCDLPYTITVTNHTTARPIKADGIAIHEDADDWDYWRCVDDCTAEGLIVYNVTRFDPSTRPEWV